MKRREEYNDATAHVSDDVCFDLVLELLPRDQMDLVLRHISSCSPCEKRFQELAGDRERSAVFANTESTTGHRARRAVSQRSVWEPVMYWLGRRRVRLGLAMGLAAVLIGMLILDRPAELDGISIGKLPPYEEVGPLRMALPPASGEALQQGLELYSEGAYEQAARGLGGFSAAGPSEAFRRIYLGSALALSGDFEAALVVLEDVPVDVVPEPWSGEGRWTLFVALRATGQTERAQEIVDELATEPGEVGDRARRFKENDK